MIWAVNSGLLSDWREVGILNLGKIWVRRIEATTDTRLLVVGKALTHPENVSTNTSRYLVRHTGGMLVKSICQSVVGTLPLA